MAATGPGPHCPAITHQALASSKGLQTPAVRRAQGWGHHGIRSQDTNISARAQLELTTYRFPLWAQTELPGADSQRSTPLPRGERHVLYGSRLQGKALARSLGSFAVWFHTRPLCWATGANLLTAQNK